MAFKAAQYPRVVPALLPSGAVDPVAIEEAARLLRQGRLVALPTETVYGLAANALDPEAVKGIFAAKGRPTFNPLIVHVLDAAAARELAADWPDNAERLAQAFWPGPLSLVVPRKQIVPLEVTGGIETVALRSPAHPVARAVLAASGLPFAAPSANRSNAISPTSAQHVVASLGDRVDLVLDAGPCTVGIESTVVDVATLSILRPGGIAADALERVVGPLRRGGSSHASPGMLVKHYAPDAITTLFNRDEIGDVLRSLPATARLGGVSVELPRPTDTRVVAWEVLGSDPIVYARLLYGALHRLEEAGVTHVVLERAPSGAAWEAVADRLLRAAGP